MKSGSVIKYSVRPGAFAPVAQLRLWDAAKWERFVAKCCRIEVTQAKKYVLVKRLGGAGDKGRDIQALLVKPVTKHFWHLYQCKYYKDPLTRSDVYGEFGKFFLHLLQGSYPEPESYYLCAPQDCGIELHDLLTGNTLDFRNDFISAWKSGALGLKVSDFTDSMEGLLMAFDFSRIKELEARSLVAIHAQDAAAHFKLFGITPQRPADPIAPTVPAVEEAKYVSALLDAYAEHANDSISIHDLPIAYESHLSGCRGEFYSAEGLKRFSRDIFPGEFNKLLDDVNVAVKAPHSDPLLATGLERLKATTSAARALTVKDSPLSDSLRPADLAGSCHHLANEGRIKWVK